MGKSGRISNRTKRNFGKSAKKIINGLSRKVTVYKQPIKLDCDNCFFDKLTGRSTNKSKWTFEEAAANQLVSEATNPGVLRYKFFRVGRCPICKGIGYIEIKRKTTVDCLVTWNPQNRSGNLMVYTAAGSEGSTVIQLKTDPKHYDVFKNCESLVIDGVPCKMSRAPLLRGLGTQDILIISAFTTEKPSIDSGEIVKGYD